MDTNPSVHVRLCTQDNCWMKQHYIADRQASLITMIPYFLPVYSLRICQAFSGETDDLQ